MLMIGRDVSEKTIGIIGAGRIGTKVAYALTRVLVVLLYILIKTKTNQ